MIKTDLKNLSLANGGFPPIKYCSDIKVDKLEKTSRKERFYAPKMNNVNIRQILKDTKSKPIFDMETDKKKMFDIDIVSE